MFRSKWSISAFERLPTNYSPQFREVCQLRNKKKLLAFLVFVGLNVVLCPCCSLSHSAVETTPKTEPAVASWNMLNDCGEYGPDREMLPSGVQGLGEAPRLQVVPGSILDDFYADDYYYDEETCMWELKDNTPLVQPQAPEGMSLGEALPLGRLP